MKKRVIGFLIIFVMFIQGCSEPSEGPSGVQEEAAVQEQPTEPEISEETPEVVEEPVTAIPAPVVEEKPAYEIFNPSLTYPGAYNGPLYGTSEQVGSASMDSYFKLLDRNGINFFIGMFGISGEPSADTLVSDQGLGEVIDAAQKHPYRVIPFFNPGIGGEEVEQYLGETLTGWYKATLAGSENVAGKGFIRGFGEVETQEWSVRHNDPKIIKHIELARDNSINFMFHPVASKADDVQKIIEAYPDTTFLFHLYREDLEKAKGKWIALLKEHDSLYFSMDAAHIIHIKGDAIYDLDSTDKESSINDFVSYYDSNEKTMINNAIKAYKPLVDAAPDKVMWGTEIGPEYAFDPQVFDRAVKISRFVIAGFDEEDREAVGYKNALRVFGQGVVADPSIKVIDTRSWLECTNSQVGSCDDSCETPDTNSLTAEQDACFLKCIIDKKCREIPEMDVG